MLSLTGALSDQISLLCRAGCFDHDFGDMCNLYINDLKDITIFQIKNVDKPSCPPGAERDIEHVTPPVTKPKVKTRQNALKGLRSGRLLFSI